MHEHPIGPLDFEEADGSGGTREEDVEPLEQVFADGADVAAANEGGGFGRVLGRHVLAGTTPISNDAAFGGFFAEHKGGAGDGFTLRDQFNGCHNHNHPSEALCRTSTP